MYYSTVAEGKKIQINWPLLDFLHRLRLDKRVRDNLEKVYKNSLAGFRKNGEGRYEKSVFTYYLKT